MQTMRGQSLSAPLSSCRSGNWSCGCDSGPGEDTGQWWGVEGGECAPAAWSSKSDALVPESTNSADGLSTLVGALLQNHKLLSSNKKLFDQKLELTRNAETLLAEAEKIPDQAIPSPNTSLPTGWD